MLRVWRYATHERGISDEENRTTCEREGERAMRNVEDTPFQKLVARERLSIADARRFLAWAYSPMRDCPTAEMEFLEAWYATWVEQGKPSAAAEGVEK